MASNFSPRVINFDDWREVLLVSIAALCGALLLFFVGANIYAFATSDSEELVSGPVIVSAQWTEFVPQRPLQPRKQTQEIVLDVDPSEGLIEDNLHSDRMQLANGTVLHPQIQLVDSHGNVFDAEVSRYPVPSRYENGLSGSVSNLPKDREFTKVRVRSDFPVRLSRIVWHCHNGK
jgi:hypothetical protein